MISGCTVTFSHCCRLFSIIHFQRIFLLEREVGLILVHLGSFSVWFTASIHAFRFDSGLQILLFHLRRLYHPGVLASFWKIHCQCNSMPHSSSNILTHWFWCSKCCCYFWTHCHHCFGIKCCFWSNSLDCNIEIDCF